MIPDQIAAITRKYMEKNPVMRISWIVFPQYRFLLHCVILIDANTRVNSESSLMIALV